MDYAQFLDRWMNGWTEESSTKHPSLWLISSLSGKGGGKKVAFLGVFPQKLFLSSYVTTYLAREKKIFNGNHINKVQQEEEPKVMVKIFTKT